MVRTKDEIICKVKTYIASMDSPVGPLKITSTQLAISSVDFVDHEFESEDLELPEVLRKCLSQLEQYFTGRLETFDLPLKPSGTDFQQEVWRALIEIPFGTTISYLELSKILGDPKAIRAVAAANGKNPIPIIIPCHRVIGSDGSLTGFAGGLVKKEWLLRHEGALAQYSLFGSF